MHVRAVSARNLGNGRFPHIPDTWLGWAVTKAVSKKYEPFYESTYCKRKAKIFLRCGWITGGQ